MEVFAKYGTPEQKERFLKACPPSYLAQFCTLTFFYIWQPLMEGKIRSSFAMTEKGVASSDARNISLSIRKEGNEIVVQGHKWWMCVFSETILSDYVSAWTLTLL
jgi:acyl-CoA dehydrogenase